MTLNERVAIRAYLSNIETLINCIDYTNNSRASSQLIESLVSLSELEICKNSLENLKLLLA